MKTLPLVVAAMSLAATLSAAVRVGDPVPVTSSNALAVVRANNELRLAGNGNNQYALWRDSAFRWFGIELTREGEPIAATQLTLTGRNGHDVTSAGGVFFALTERIEPRALVVSRIEADGTRAREVAINAEPSSARIVASESRVFAIYQHEGDGAMRAIVLSGSLNIITNDFAISGSNKLPAAFAATMLGDRALIAWRNDNGGAAAALVDTRGNVTPLDLLIDDAFIAPALASSGSDDARLLWYTGAHSLNAMDLDANGKPGARFTVAMNTIPSHDVIWDGDEYRAVWLKQGCDASTYDVITGPLSGQSFIISGEHPATVGNARMVRSGGDAFIGWIASRCGGGTPVAAGRLTTSPAINSFSLGVPDQVTPSVVVANGVTYTAWREAGAIRVGKPNQPSVLIATTGSLPRIAFDGATLLVAWIDDEKRIFGRFLNTDLVFLGELFQIGSGADSVAIEWYGGSYTAVWNTPGAARITTGGNVTLLPAFLSTPTAGPPAISKNLVVWSEQVGEEQNKVSTILGRFIGEDKIFTVATVRAIPNAGSAGLLSGWSPRVVCGKSDCLVTWTQRNGPGRGTEGHAARVSIDGTLLDINVPRLFFRNDSVTDPIILPVWDGEAYSIVANDEAHISIGPFGGTLETVIIGKFFEFAAMARPDGPAVIAYTKVTNPIPITDPGRRAFVIEAEQISVRRRPTGR